MDQQFDDEVFTKCKCGKLLVEFRKDSGEYMGIKQYGAEARVCMNVGRCSMAFSAKDMKGWTLSSKIKKSNAEKQKEIIDERFAKAGYVDVEKDEDVLFRS